MTKSCIIQPVMFASWLEEAHDHVDHRKPAGFGRQMPPQPTRPGSKRHKPDIEEAKPDGPAASTSAGVLKAGSIEDCVELEVEELLRKEKKNSRSKQQPNELEMMIQCVAPLKTVNASMRQETSKHVCASRVVHQVCPHFH